MRISVLKSLGLFAFVTTVEAAQKYTRVADDHDHMQSVAQESVAMIFGTFLALTAAAVYAGCAYGFLVGVRDRIHAEMEQAAHHEENQAAGLRQRIN